MNEFAISHELDSRDYGECLLWGLIDLLEHRKHGELE